MPASSEPTDEILLQASLAADESGRGAFRALCDRLWPILFAVAARRLGEDPDEAGDTVQNALLVLARIRARFERNRRVRSWVFGILDFEIRKTLARRGNIAPGSPIEAATGKAGRATSLRRRERDERVVKAVDALPEVLARVIRLRYFDGRTHEEIGVEMNLPRTTVQERIAEALALLRPKIGEVEAAA